MERRSVETISGIVFLALMVLFLVLAITTFEGTPTVLLVVAALVFLPVGLYLLGGSMRGGGDEAPSQQQSVVLSDGRLVTQSSGSGGSAVLAVCPKCSARVPESYAHCPHCGAGMGA